MILLNTVAKMILNFEHEFANIDIRNNQYSCIDDTQSLSVVISLNVYSLPLEITIEPGKSEKNIQIIGFKKSIF